MSVYLRKSIITNKRGVIHNFHSKSWVVTAIYFRGLPYIMKSGK